MAVRISKELYRAFENLDAPIELLALIGSLRDTLPDDEIAVLLKDYNDTGEYMRKVTMQ